jgi:hypothetical protein
MPSQAFFVSHRTRELRHLVRDAAAMPSRTFFVSHSARQQWPNPSEFVSQCPPGHSLFPMSSTGSKPSIALPIKASRNALPGILCFPSFEGVRGSNLIVSQCPPGHSLFPINLFPMRDNPGDLRRAHRVAMPSRAFFVSHVARPSRPGSDDMASQCPPGHSLFPIARGYAGQDDL